LVNKTAHTVFYRPRRPLCPARQHDVFVAAGWISTHLCSAPTLCCLPW
jgi:hypothetical protein